MATSWQEKGGQRTWRTLAVAFSIFLISMQSPGWSLGMFMRSLFSPVFSTFFGKLWFLPNSIQVENTSLRDNQNSDHIDLGHISYLTESSRRLSWTRCPLGQCIELSTGSHQRTGQKLLLCYLLWLYRFFEYLSLDNISRYQVLSHNFSLPYQYFPSRINIQIFLVLSLLPANISG